MKRLLSLLTFTFVGGLLIGALVVTFLSPHPDKPAIGAQKLMDGLATGDGGEVWDSYSPNYQQKLSDQDGVSLAKERTDDVSYYKSWKAKVPRFDVEYLGGGSVDNFGVYVYRTHSKDAKGQDSWWVWQVLTNSDGKVIEVQ